METAAERWDRTWGQQSQERQNTGWWNRPTDRLAHDAVGFALPGGFNSENSVSKIWALDPATTSLATSGGNRYCEITYPQNATVLFGIFTESHPVVPGLTYLINVSLKYISGDPGGDVVMSCFPTVDHQDRSDLMQVTSAFPMDGAWHSKSVQVSVPDGNIADIGPLVGSYAPAVTETIIAVDDFYLEVV